VLGLYVCLSYTREAHPSPLRVYGVGRPAMYRSKRRRFIRVESSAACDFRLLPVEAARLCRNRPARTHSTSDRRFGTANIEDRRDPRHADT